MHTFHTIADLRQALAYYRAKGKTIGFVPTMGALHAGHLSLVELAQAKSDVVAVSIFVNPSQFAPHEDFASYPRPEKEDAALLRKQKVDILYMPSVEEMYPHGYSEGITTGEVGKILEGVSRPHFFDGVALVVSKLFQQVQPHLAVFGEKDYQQLHIIRQLVRDLDMPVEIIAAPIARDVNGLALSSRNAYLSEEERTRIAPCLYRILQESAARLKKGEAAETVLSEAKAQLLRSGFTAVDYLELRDARTLAPCDKNTGNAVLLAAARIGATRLLDNLRLSLS